MQWDQLISTWVFTRYLQKLKNLPKKWKEIRMLENELYEPIVQRGWTTSNYLFFRRIYVLHNGPRPVSLVQVLNIWNYSEDVMVQNNKWILFCHTLCKYTVGEITADAHPGVSGVSKDQIFCKEFKNVHC